MKSVKNEQFFKAIIHVGMTLTPGSGKENSCTVKPVLSGHSKTDKTKVLNTNGSLMKIKSIAECSPWSILQYF